MANTEGSDPLSLYLANQERAAKDGEGPTLWELKEKNPRWATCFERNDTDQDQMLKQGAEVHKAFSQVLGINEPYPKRRLDEIYKELDPTDVGKIDFRAFCELVKAVVSHMTNTPKWQEKEEAANEAERKEQERQARADKKKALPDINDLLGIKSSSLAGGGRKSLGGNRGGMGGGVLGKMMGSASAGGLPPSGLVSKLGAATSGTGERRNSLSNVSSALASAANSIVSKNMPHRDGSSSSDGIQAVGGAGSSDEPPREKKIIRRRITFQPNMGSDPGGAMGRAATVGGVLQQANNEESTQELRSSWSYGRQVSKGSSAKRNVQKAQTIEDSGDIKQFIKIGGGNAACMTLRFNDEGSQLAGGFFDGTLRIYNTDTNKLQHLTRGKEAIPVIKKKSDDYYDDRDLEEDFKPMDALKESGEASLTAVRWLPGNSKVNIVSTVDTQGIVALWEVPHYKRGAGAVPKLLHRIEGSAEKKAVEGMCFTNDGTKVLIGGADKFIKAFDIEKLKMSNEQMYGHKAPAPEKIAGHALKIVAMEAHPVEANVFFSGGLDRKVCIWDLRMETPAGVIHGCDVSGDAIKCSNKNKLLVASHRSQDPFQIHDLRKIGSKASEKPGVSPSASPRSPLSPATDDPDRVDLWESTGHKSYDWRGDETPFEKRAAPTMCLPFSASWDEDCKIMVSCGEQENFARIYELPDNNAADRLSVVGTYYGSNASFLTAAVSRDGKNVAFGSGAGGLLFLEVRL